MDHEIYVAHATAPVDTHRDLCLMCHLVELPPQQPDQVGPVEVVLHLEVRVLPQGEGQAVHHHQLHLCTPTHKKATWSSAKRM